MQKNIKTHRAYSMWHLNLSIIQIIGEINDIDNGKGFAGKCNICEYNTMYMW